MTEFSAAALESDDVDLRPSIGPVELRDRERAAWVLAAIVAFTISARTGIGASLFVTASLLLVAWVSRGRTNAAAWCVVAAAMLGPWLVVRDNTWLFLCVVFTAGLVVSVSTFASATRQRCGDLALGVLGKAIPKQVAREVAPRDGHDADRIGLAVFRGVLIAVPVVGVFWLLLASADPVFARIAPPSSLPVLRFGLFVVLLPLCLLLVRFAATDRVRRPDVASRQRGEIESSIVLGAVAVLFSAFVTLRLAMIGRELSDVAWRSEVRSGFFQLLWVAALTIAMVLVVRQVAGSPALGRRLRSLTLITIVLASMIDLLALVRIAAYVERSFLSPLRYWSFGFGLWLLVVLGLAALRVAGLRADRRWFTVALVSSWMVFVFLMGLSNPDDRIAQHNFANAPTGVDEWIAVKPLIWLSDDATPTIVENIEVLRPMPNDRYERMVAHLCADGGSETWRDAHFSRSAARKAIEDLC